jgi:hypothetical protein
MIEIQESYIFLYFCVVLVWSVHLNPLKKLWNVFSLINCVIIIKINFLTLKFPKAIRALSSKGENFLMGVYSIRLVSLERDL